MIARNFQRTLFNAMKAKPSQPIVAFKPFSHYNFCSTNENKAKSKLDEKTRQIFNELKNKDNLGTGTQRINKEKHFGNYVIYEHHMDSKEIKLKISLRLLASSIWFGAGVAVFHYVHHLAALIPLIIMSRSIMSYSMGRKYTKQLINKVQLSEDKTTVKLFSVSGDVYECLVAEMDFQDINDLSEAKTNDKKLKDDKDSELSKLKQSSFLAIFDTTDTEGVFRRDLKILFNDQLVNMENADLLTKVLRGQKDEVMAYQYVDEYEDTSEEDLSDEKLEEQLQEEIRRKKK